MTVQDDIALVKQQERELVLPQFDEDVAFALGSALRERALADSLGIVIDVRSWDRQMFFAATAGTSADNAEWVRRKINTVRRFHKASYRMALERGEVPFSPQSGADPADFVIAGGGFPIRVLNAGIIGCVTVSGLPGRQDHGVVVDMLCDHLGKSRDTYRLAAE